MPLPTGGHSGSNPPFTYRNKQISLETFQYRPQYASTLFNQTNLNIFVISQIKTIVYSRRLRNFINVYEIPECLTSNNVTHGHANSSRTEGQGYKIYMFNIYSKVLKVQVFNICTYITYICHKKFDTGLIDGFIID